MSTDLVLRLTVVVTMLYSATTAWTVAPLRVVCALMLVAPTAVRDWRWWFSLSICAGVGVVATWDVSDNHKYLIAYWCVACAAALFRSSDHPDLATPARYLVALVFVIAVAWKITVGQYLNGQFWYATLLIDERVQGLASLVSGHGVRELALARAAVQQLGVQGFSGTALPLQVLPRLKLFALLLSWLTLLVETSVGVVHLFGRKELYALRHAMLLSFMAGTYLLLPVLGFAGILMVLGLAQCRSEDRLTTFAYCAVLIAIQIFRLPSQAIVGG